MTAGHDAEDHVDPTMEPEGGVEESTEPSGPPADQPVSEPTVEGEPEGAAEADEASDSEPEPEPAAPTAEEQLAERTADLQRLHAEYQNYRKRVERDRALSRGQGKVDVLRSLLTVLDDIGRAEQHGELEGGFKAVADELRQALRSHGLEAFGAEGDVFDPRLHEALFQVGQSAEAQETAVGTVVRTGYRVGDEVVRHAQVGVVEPGAPEEPATDDTAGDAADDEPDGESATDD